MKVGWLSVFGLATAVALIFIFLIVIQQQFPQQGFLQLVSVEEDVGQEVSATLWGQRQLDLIVLAFVLFATATCCRAMFRVEEREDT
jgi:hypothetical protein